MTTKQKIIFSDKSVARIGGIRLLSNGIKGIKISYETMESEDRQNYSNNHKDERHRPVHGELKELVRSLKSYFLELTGYAYATKTDAYEALEMCTEITGIDAGTDRFLITGTIRSWEDKIIAVNTPLIKEGDMYDRFEEVMELVDKIYKQADLYMRGVKRATTQEVVVDYMKVIKKSSNFTYDMFENMTPEEQSELMSGMQKDLGFEVIDENGVQVLSVDDSANHLISVNDEMEDLDDDIELLSKKPIKLNIG